MIFRCPHCNKKLKAPADGAGRKAVCPKCLSPVRVPPPVRSNPSALPQEPPRDRLGEWSVGLGLSGLAVKLLAWFTYARVLEGLDPSSQSWWETANSYVRYRDEYAPLRLCEWAQKAGLVLILVGLALALLSFINPARSANRSWGVAGCVLNLVLILWVVFRLGLL